MKDVYELKTPLPPPPTREEQLQRALAILNNLDADYEIKVLGKHYYRQDLNM